MNKTDEFELGMMEPTRDRLIARIEALEAAGKRLADAAVRLDADDITSALAAWRAAELKALCNAPLDTDAPEGEAEFETWLNDDPKKGSGDA